MQVNQNGDPIEEEVISEFNGFLNESEMTEAILLLAERLGVDIVRTNSTKHGDVILELRNV